MPGKLRASCDACYSAKMKCIRTNSGCQRCDNSAGELVCTYSPDLPRIPHKRSSRHHADDSQTSHSTLLQDLHDTQPTFNQENYAPAADSLPTFDWQAYSIGVNAEPNSFFGQYLPQSSTGIPPNPVPWPSSVDATSTTTTTPALTDAASPASAISTTFLPPFTNQPRASHTQNFRHHVSAAPATPSQQTMFEKAPCSCFTNLSEAMQRMNALTTCYSPPKLDAVLSTNVKATKQCLASLQCSHPFETASHTGASSCAIIACGLLDRILASYQAALQAFCASLDGKGERGSEGHVEKMWEEREHDEHESVSARTASVQVRIGSFAPDRSEQVVYARRMVARQVEKIQTVLKAVGSAGPDVQSVLLTHLMERCKEVVSEVSGG